MRRALTEEEAIVHELTPTLAIVEAASEAEAIAKGAEQFGQDAKRLIAVRR
jgi:hypothetical protein